MTRVPIFIKFNGAWDSYGRYTGGEMKGVMIHFPMSYAGLTNLLTDALELRGKGKTLVLKYSVQDGEPPIKVRSDEDVIFYLELKKRDVHVLSKFPLCVDVVDQPLVDMLPPDNAGSNEMQQQGDTVFDGFDKHYDGVQGEDLFNDDGLNKESDGDEDNSDSDGCDTAEKTPCQESVNLTSAGA